MSQEHFKMINGSPLSDSAGQKDSDRLGRRTVAIHTLGCKVNSYESDAMAEQFKMDGYTVVDDNDVADVYVINTCTVTNLGNKKSRQFIRRAKKKNPAALMAVVGCYSQVAPEEVMAIEGVNLIIGTNERKRIVEFLQDLTVADQVCMVGDIMQVKDFEELELEDTMDRTRAFIKIQEGCNQYCSYCIIPYARGPIRSRKPENVLREVERLVSNGFKEVVLTGIHVASYGKDLESDDLIGLMERVHAVEGLQRLRLSSLEPRLMNEDFVGRLAKMDKFCPHFHLSLQSGSDTVLKRMNRKYDTAAYLEAVRTIRSHFEMPALTTDVIVGFPGETVDEFEETMRFVEKVGFHQVHVFKYSPKKGTPAASMGCQVHPDVKQTRSDQLIDLSERLEREYVTGFIGHEVNVLFENKSEKRSDMYEGLTDNYIRVLVKSDEDLQGAIKKVVVEGVEEGVLIGSICVS